MEQDTAKKIEDRLAGLPQDVRNAVLSVEWEAKVQAIGAKHQLHIDQIGALGDTTLMAMLGMFDIAQYPTEVSKALNVAPELAATIAKEVSDEVFVSIRESLRGISQQKPAPVPFPAMNTAPAAVAAPAAPALTPTPTPTVPKPDLSAADAMLNSPVVSQPAAAPSVPMAPPSSTAPTPTPAAPIAPEAPKAPTYSSDPYREPPTP